LDAVISDALAKGATVRLVGDDGQIASISAGGVLRDIAAETDALTLSQLVRFTAPEEGAASLALRAGDPSGIGFYIDRGRVHVGADETAADMAFQAWLADQRAGRDTLLLAPTNAIVDELNVRARSARLAALAQADPQWRPGRDTLLSDQLAASAGDIIRTRDNARWLRLSATDYVRNGYTYEVLDVGADGSLRVRHIGTDREITLPADYVTSEVTLGYATTIDGAQGLTAGHSCHVVGAEHLSRQLLYVALTRGRVENHVYLSTAEDDPHRILAPKATHPDTAVACVAPRARQREHRDDDDRAAGQCERARALGEHDDRRARRQQRAGPARQRVHERQVAVAVAALQEDEVERVECAAAHHEHDPLDAERAGRDEHRDDDGRQPDRDRRGGEQPHERRAAARGLREHVPGSVGERREDDEDEGGGGH